MPADKPDYGLDAPGVVRNFFLIAGSGLLVFGAALVTSWNGNVGPIPLAGIGLWTAVICVVTGSAMIYSSRVGKVRGRVGLLDHLPWRGDEQVLDVGCGRGLLLIEAARRLKTGKATGIDIWQTEDLSGNRPEATLENARLEGVSDRVELRTADMREMPFPDNTFDSVVSSWAVHNLYQAPDRAKALREIARVLKPGGRLLLRDIKHGAAYAAVLKDAGLPDVRRVDHRLGSLAVMLWTFGGVRPVILTGTKKPAGT